MKWGYSKRRQNESDAVCQGYFENSRPVDADDRLDCPAANAGILAGLLSRGLLEGVTLLILLLTGAYQIFCMIGLTKELEQKAK